MAASRRSRPGGSCPARPPRGGAPRVRRSSVSGTPMSLLRLPWVAWAASPARRAGWTRSSASPWSCRCCRSRRSAATRTAGAPAAGQARPGPASVSGTSTPGRPAAPGRWCAMAATAPAACAGLRQEVMGIEALALERHEQVAGLQAAGVGVHARDRGGCQHRPPRGRPVSQGSAGPRSSCRPPLHGVAGLQRAAARLRSRSENGFSRP